MSGAFFASGAAISATGNYWAALYTWIFRGKTYSENEIYFAKDDVQAMCQVYGLALCFTMWDLPHYRSRSYQQDMLDNLRNVAVPGTGIPLSVFCHSWWVCLFFVLFTVPTICFFGACNKVRLHGGGVEALMTHYKEHLLHPQDWFSYWQLNCRLVSLHSQKLRARGYQLEDKWSFLKEGEALGVPVSPFFQAPRRLVIKHKDIEGGMGIYFFDNAVHGGDWILQADLKNAPWLQELLPSPAPLSTMRVITSSTWTMAKHGHVVAKKEFASAIAAGTVPTPEIASGDAKGVPSQSTDSETLRNRKGKGKGKGKHNAEPHSNEMSSERLSTDGELSGVNKMRATLAEASRYVTARSAVLRLGRAGAATDHSSVLFDVDIKSGTIKEGRSNAHWYKLGPVAASSCPWLPPNDGFSSHPDTPGKPAISGRAVPQQEWEAAMDIVVRSHYNMLPDVPMVGWDVAFCEDGIFLLEVNLSCNFFRGTFDTEDYFSFVDGHFRDLENR